MNFDLSIYDDFLTEKECSDFINLYSPAMESLPFVYGKAHKLKLATERTHKGKRTNGGASTNAYPNELHALACSSITGVALDVIIHKTV